MNESAAHRALMGPLRHAERLGLGWGHRLAGNAPEHEIAAAAHHYVGEVRSRMYAQRVSLPAASLRVQLDVLAAERQARPVAPDVGLAGTVQRMVDPQWWSRNLRRQLLRAHETELHAAGHIRRSRDCYVSEHAMRRRAAREKINRATLGGLEVVNEEGSSLNLLEVSDNSVSNPRKRRTELMVRCRGFEEVAKFSGHEAVFLTITCPSRFHRFDGQGKPNARWDGSTPKDAQRYLCEVWARIRADWKRAGFSPYGFRVAEPHHDGCPHWHLLLFAPAHHVGWFNARRLVADGVDHGAGLVGIAGAHALREAGGEAGALKHRFTCERIDPEKGSATGYIAKYIAKNVDGETEAGEEVGLDFASGKGAVEGARRVRAWASTWGIRQFQQIGGPSVTVWRELRRLAQDAQEPVLQLELFEGPRSAADRSLWALFWLLQGGPDVPRAQLTLRPMYALKGCGKYGDEVERVHGVAGWDADSQAAHECVTRLHTWTVQQSGKADADATQAHWNRQRQTLEALGIAPEAWGPYLAGEAGPWTGVNNCTEGVDVEDDDAVLRADFLRGQGGQTFKVIPDESRNEDGPCGLGGSGAGEPVGGPRALR